jgi:protein-S-isoprenylcysteine O-methyltransferase Ste14
MPSFPDALVVFAALFVVGGLVQTGLPIVLRGADVLGKAPIHPVPWVTAKLAMFTAGGWAPVAVLVPSLRWLNPPGMLSLVGAALYAFGALGIVLASRDLGDKALKVGLPEGDTGLRTEGLYRLSRNPIYACGDMMVLSSAVLAPHPVNWLAGILCIAIHHRIILAEERFLDRRFGAEWRRYQTKAGRYFYS